MGALTFAMPFGWSWNLCMLFGSIMSTTDTVAVVALLNEAGASSWLTMLITGESLLNDSTGIVMFTLFFNMNLGKTYNASSIISFLCVTIIGSALLGIAFGFIAIRWLRIVNRPLIAEDMTVQIAITLVCAYLSFLTAQYYCDISGVLACSFAGGMLAWLGPPLILNHETVSNSACNLVYISHRNIHSFLLFNVLNFGVNLIFGQMHNVWDMLEWLGNTLIFILAGLIFGSRTLDNVAPIDWLYLIVLYIFLNLTRVVVVFSHFPLLTRLGNGCTMPEALFMCWSGLRGALGIVLASIVETSFQELGISSVQGNRLFFYVGGLSALTLVVNATTAKIVLRRLRLVNTATADKDIIINQTRRRIRKKLDHLLISIRNLNQFSVAELDEIKECCSAFQKKDGRESLVATDRATSIGRGSLFVGLQQLMETAEQQEVTMESLSKPALLAYVRTVYLEIVRVHYWHMIEEGKLPRHSATATMLLYSIEVGLDHVKESTLSDFKVIEDEVINSQRRLLMLLDYLIKYLGPLSMYFSFLREMLVALREKRSVRALLAFIEAHEHAQEKIQEIFHVEANGHHTNEVKRPEEQIVIKESKKSVREIPLPILLHVPLPPTHPPLLCLCVALFSFLTCCFLVR